MSCCPADGPARLERGLADAIDDLGRLVSNDPAARSALNAVRLARLTLEDFWRPAVVNQPRRSPPVDARR